MADAAARVRELGDPLLAEHADSAMRKLACDLPVDAAAAGATPDRSRRGRRPRPSCSRPWARRSSAGSGSPSTTAAWAATATGGRTVEPFGLFFLNQHWYLAARAPGEETVKNYRAQPDRRPEVNAGQAGHAGLRDPRRLRPPRPRPLPPGLGARRRRRGRRRRRLPRGDRRRRRRRAAGRGGRGPAATGAASGSAGPTPSPAGSSPSPATSSRSPRASSSTSTAAWSAKPSPITPPPRLSDGPADRDTAADQLRRILHLIPRSPTGSRTDRRGRRARSGVDRDR